MNLQRRLKRGSSPWRRRLQIAQMAVGVAVLHHWLIRPRMLNWGAAGDDRTRPLPGDELRTGRGGGTRARTIDAPPSVVWPWLVQVGYGRGGWYSYDWVERLLLAGKYVEGHSATRIHEELQVLSVGDVVPFGVGVEIPVNALKPERHLVIGEWSFVLEPEGEGQTRLLVRTGGAGFLRVPVQRIPVLRELASLVDYVLGEPLHFAMERRMMLGLAQRSEAGAGSPISTSALTAEPAIR